MSLALGKEISHPLYDRDLMRQQLARIGVERERPRKNVIPRGRAGKSKQGTPNSHEMGEAKFVLQPLRGRGFLSYIDRREVLRRQVSSLRFIKSTTSLV